MSGVVGLVWEVWAKGWSGWSGWFRCVTYGFYVYLVPRTTTTTTRHESFVDRLTYGCKPVKIFEVEAIHLKGLHFMIDMPDRKLLFCIEGV